MKKNILKIVLIIFILMFNIVNIVYAASYQPYGSYKLYNGYASGGYEIVSVAKTIGGYIKYAAIVVAVIMLMVKGIKFITSSPEGKADAKKEMIPWAIGVVLLFTLSLILSMFAEVGESLNNVRSL